MFNFQLESVSTISAQQLYTVGREIERRQTESDTAVEARLSSIEEQTSDLIEVMSLTTAESLNRTDQSHQHFVELVESSLIAHENLRNENSYKTDLFSDYCRNETTRINERLESMKEDLMWNASDLVYNLKTSIESKIDNSSAYLYDVARGLKAATEFTNALRLEVGIIEQR